MKDIPHGVCVPDPGNGGCVRPFFNPEERNAGGPHGNVASIEVVADALLWVASHRQEARTQALQGRELVGRDWSREKAFGDLADILNEVSAPRRNRRAVEDGMAAAMTSRI